MPKHVWAIRVWSEIAESHRELALFHLAIDNKLHGCDFVRLKVADIYASGQVKERTSIIQSKSQRPVRFEITEGTGKSILRWMEDPLMIGTEYLWQGPLHERMHISTRQRPHKESLPNGVITAIMRKLLVLADALITEGRKSTPECLWPSRILKWG